MNEQEQKQFITGLATSPGFFQAMMACSKNIEGPEPTIQEVGLWFYSCGYMDCMEFQKQKRITRPYKTAIANELKKTKKK